MNYYNDFYHFGKIIGEFQFATSSCYSKKEVNEMNTVIYLNTEQSLLEENLFFINQVQEY